MEMPAVLAWLPQFIAANRSRLPCKIILKRFLFSLSCIQFNKWGVLVIATNQVDFPVNHSLTIFIILLNVIHLVPGITGVVGVFFFKKKKIYFPCQMRLN